MQKKVTQNDVAREAGVTRSMVSYVISGNSERSVAPETRERILQVIARLGYRPNKAAQALQQGNEAFAKNKIGVIICNAEVFIRPYYAEILAGIHTAAHKNNYHIGFIRFFSELQNPILFNELIHTEEIGGLILVSLDQCVKSEADKKIIEQIKQRIPKIVCVEWLYNGLSSVGFDRQNAAKKAALYILNKHFFPIAYIGETDDRISGVFQAFAESQVEISNFISQLPADNLSSGYNAISELDSKGKMPRGIVCGSDEVAIGVLHYLNEKKIAVPEQVALISIDNIEGSAYANPSITTINVQKTQMGARAVEMIVSGTAVQGENAINISLPTNLVVRESS